MKAVSLIGVPQWLGQTRYGTNLGPDALRYAGLVKRLNDLCGDIVDIGDILISHPTIRHSEPGLKNLRAIVATNERLAARVAEVVEQQRFPLVLGGDHSIAIGSIAGVAKRYRNLGVIWYDAHADINTHETTPSGNIHGMPLAACLGVGHPALVGIGGFQPKVRSEDIVFIGIRDIDPGERDLIRDKQLKVYTVSDIDRMGMDKVIEEAVGYLAERCDGIHLSFDLDGIDPCEMPGVGTPVCGGISLADSLVAMRALAATNRITSCEVVELNPVLDKEQKATIAAIDLVAALFGATQTESIPSGIPKVSRAR